MRLAVDPSDLPLLARAHARGLRVLEQVGPDTYAVTSSRPGVIHRVWLGASMPGSAEPGGLLRNPRPTCTCELNTLGHQRCPHIALACFHLAFLRQQEVARRTAMYKVPKGGHHAA